MEQKPSQRQIQSEKSEIMRGDLRTENNDYLTQEERNEARQFKKCRRIFNKLPNSLKKSSEESHVEANMHIDQSEEFKKGSSDPPSLTASSEECYLSSQKSVKQTHEGSNANPWIAQTNKDNHPSQDENDSSSITCHKADGKSAKVNPFGADVDADSARFKESISKNSLEALDLDKLQQDSVKLFTERDESPISSSKYRSSLAGEYYSIIWEKSKKTMKELNVQQKFIDFQIKIYSEAEEKGCDKIYAISPYKVLFYCKGYGSFYTNCFLKIPDASKMTILSKKLKNLGAFFDQTFPRRVKVLEIGNCNRDCILRNHKLNQIVRISSAVKKEICFWSFQINEKHLKRFLAAFRHVETVGFKKSNLLVPRVPDFSLALKGSKIRVLKFDKSVISSRRNDLTNPGEVKNLVQGLATSPDLKEDLQEFHIKEWKFEGDLQERFEEEFAKKFVNSFAEGFKTQFGENFTKNYGGTLVDAMKGKFSKEFVSDYVADLLETNEFEEAEVVDEE
ncbi:unnamed protein product [Moneuplotes crassus]|uniref:Uncharacterized protein n=1 Tax=Euplotes crassus TaxID=5936 RepID=A0AAD2DAZ1_EUPCR|nr:unnamed protein product [Moneuplotes crassus]